jgi:hypothetical protein
MSLQNAAATTVTAATTSSARGPSTSLLGELLAVFRPQRLDFNLELSQQEVDADLRHGRDDE